MILRLGGGVVSKVIPEALIRLRRLATFYKMFFSFDYNHHITFCYVKSIFHFYNLRVSLSWSPFSNFVCYYYNIFSRVCQVKVEIRVSQF
jgi:hypothetical protein